MAYTVSEFTVGFELEAIFLNNIPPSKFKTILDTAKEEEVYSEGKKEKVHTYIDLDKDSRYRDYWLERQEIVKNKLNSIIPPKDKDDFGVVVDDWSIEQKTLEDVNKGAVTFEWNSPKLQFTISNMKLILKLLKSLPKMGVITNDSCALHIHVSWPFLTEEDMIWIVCQIAIDSKATKHISTFQKYDFVDMRYSSDVFLSDIASSLQSMQYPNIKDALFKYFALSIKKQAIFVLHPQKTLEWRGPRRFLQDIDVIKDFMIHLRTFIQIVNSKLEIRTIINTSRTDFFRKLNFKGKKGKFLVKKYSSNFTKNYNKEELKKVYSVPKFKSILKNGKFAKANITMAYRDKDHFSFDGIWYKGTLSYCLFKGTFKNGIYDLNENSWYENTAKWIKGRYLLPDGTLSKVSKLDPLTFAKNNSIKIGKNFKE